MKTAKDLAETLATIAEKAKALRDAGIVGRVSVGDVSFDLGGVVAPPQPDAERDLEDDGLGNALDDGDTYGGHVPRRRVRGTQERPPEDDED